MSLISLVSYLWVGTSSGLRKFDTSSSAWSSPSSLLYNVGFKGFCNDPFIGGSFLSKAYNNSQGCSGELLYTSYSKISCAFLLVGYASGTCSQSNGNTITQEYLCSDSQCGNCTLLTSNSVSSCTTQGSISTLQTCSAPTPQGSTSTLPTHSTSIKGSTSTLPTHSTSIKGSNSTVLNSTAPQSIYFSINLLGVVIMVMFLF